MSVPTEFKLNHGGPIPAVGLGTWQAKPGEVAQAVEHALNSGYRHIDGALCYQVSWVTSTARISLMLTFGRTRMKSVKVSRLAD